VFSQLKPKQNNPKRSGPRQGFKIKISPTEILKCTFYITELFAIFYVQLKTERFEHNSVLFLNKILNHYYQSTLLYIKIHIFRKFSLNAQCPFASLPAAETKAV